MLTRASECARRVHPHVRTTTAAQLTPAALRARGAQSRLLQQRVRLQKQLPERRKALDTVLMLRAKQARPARLRR